MYLVASAHVLAAGTTTAIASPGTGLRIVIHHISLSAAAAASGQVTATIGGSSKVIASTTSSNDIQYREPLECDLATAVSFVDVGTTGADYTILYVVKPG